MTKTSIRPHFWSTPRLLLMLFENNLHYCYHNNIVLFVSDGSMLRTCASIGVDDCETANGVTYCYCKNELCNNPSKKLSNPNPGSGLLSSPQKSTELLIDTNKQKIEGEVILHASQMLSQF